MRQGPLPLPAPVSVIGEEALTSSRPFLSPAGAPGHRPLLAGAQAPLSSWHHEEVGDLPANHNRRHEISPTHSFMSVDVGVDEDTGATCLLPGAHLIVDGPDAILVHLFTTL